MGWLQGAKESKGAKERSQGAKAPVHTERSSVRTCAKRQGFGGKRADKTL